MEQDIKSIGDYWEIVKRWKIYFIIPSVTIFVITLLLVMFLPAIYRSEGTILVESQQIPTDFVESTITSYAEERIQVIKQIVMTRENLLKIIEKNNLYEEERKTEPVSRIIEMMHKNIFVEIISGDISGAMSRRRSAPSIAFTVAFEHPVPEVARSVTNELVTLFLSENLKSRTERASQTTSFLSNEAEKLKKELDIIETQVAEYKQQYKDSLPENLDLNTRLLEQAKRELDGIERDIKSERDQKAYLEVQLASLQTAIPTDREEPLTPKQQLAFLESQYKELTLKYGPAHPDIKRIERQITELKAQLVTRPDNSDTNSVARNPAMMLAQAQISSAKSKILSLEKEREKIKEKIKMLEERILATPQVERGFKVLDRDYEKIKEKYEELKTKESSARLSQSMEEQSKAERFALIDPPDLPINPVKPSRKKILLIGLMFAFGGGLSLVIFRDYMDKNIYGAKQLTRIIKQAPLVTIPYIETSTDKARRRRFRKVA